MSDLEGSLKEAERILCSDGNCIGTINEKGFCNICGKPRGAVRERERSHLVNRGVTKDEGVLERVLSGIEGVFGSALKGIGGVLAVIVALGVVLFLGATVLLVIWKIVKWAWS
jgi:hypothetical protein